MGWELKIWSLPVVVLLFLSCSDGIDFLDSRDPVAELESVADVFLELLPDFQTDDNTDVTSCQEPPRLEFVLEFGDNGMPCKGQKVCEIYLCPSEDRKLEVMLTECGFPVWGAWLTYEIQNDPQELAQLEYGMAYTNADGVGSRSLGLSKNTIGEFQVHVCYYGVPETDCVDFNVKHLPCGDTVPLVVGFDDYNGAYPLIDNARVYLFKRNENAKPMCDSLKYDNLPTVTVMSPTVGITHTAQFPWLPDLQTEKVQNYTIVGLAKAGQGSVQAWGCEDGSNPDKPTQVQFGGHVYVGLELVDIVPQS